MDSRQWSEWMAFDRIEPPDLWPSTIARLLYALVCSWSSDTPPAFDSFLPPTLRGDGPGLTSEAAILAAYGFAPQPGSPTDGPHA